MQRVERSVLIGSGGRNVGKTEFAVALIRYLKQRCPVHAVKITTIYDDRHCPRGSTGCGVCSDMACEILLTEERPATGNKDTQRMLSAGADRVWWLRVRESGLAEVPSHIGGLVPPDGVLIIESNAARTVIEPDLFFMATNSRKQLKKESSQRVVQYADEIVTRGDDAFAPVLSRISVADRCLVLKRNAAAVVLAGGESSRMGADKRRLGIGGEPMLERLVRTLRPHFTEITLSVSGQDAAHSLGTEDVQSIADIYPGTGPLGAIASALQRATKRLNFVIACDIPDPPMGFAAHLLCLARSHQVVIPVTENGDYEPLFAVYDSSCEPTMRRALERGERRIISAFSELDVCAVPIPRGVTLKNLNTREEYEDYLGPSPDDHVTGRYPVSGPRTPLVFP